MNRRKYGLTLRDLERRRRAAQRRERARVGLALLLASRKPVTLISYSEADAKALVEEAKKLLNA